MEYLQIGIGALLPVAFSGFIYLIATRTKMTMRSYWTRQWTIGIVFGLLSALATVFGVSFDGMYINVRDAAPICAGLIFGLPAGLISGLIGAAARLLLVLFGQGAYTAIGCSLACLIAGTAAGLSRKYLTDNQIPSTLYGVVLTLVIEAVHMLLTLVTHMMDLSRAFTFVSTCAFPIMFSNSIAVGLALLCVHWLKRNAAASRPVSSMNQSIRIWLVLCAFSGFLVTALVTYTVESVVGFEDIERVMKESLKDIKTEMTVHTAENIDPLKLSDDIRPPQIGHIYILNAQNEIVKTIPAGSQTEPDLSVLAGTMPGILVQGQESDVQKYYMYSYCGPYTIIASTPSQQIMHARMAATSLIVMIEMVIYLIMFVVVYILTSRLIYRGMFSIGSILSQIPGSTFHASDSLQNDFAEISDDIVQTAHYLKTYVENAETARLQAQEDAAAVEMAMVPNIFPPFPEIDTFDIYARLLPSHPVQGGFYNFYLLSSRRICFYIGEVSGSGMPSVIEALEVKNRIRDHISSGEVLSQVFRQLNQMVRQKYPGTVCRLWLGILDTSNGLLEYINAGHMQPALLIRGNGKRIQEMPSAPFGQDEDAVFMQHRMFLQPGDRIAVFSDGMVRSTDSSGEAFGEKRLLARLKQHQYSSPMVVVSEGMETLERFTGGCLPEECPVLLELELKSLQTENTIILQKDKAALDKLIAFAEKRSRQLELSAAMERRVMLTAETLFTYVVNYSDSTQDSVSLMQENGDVILTLTDNGHYDLEKERIIFRQDQHNPVGTHNGTNLYLLNQFADFEAETINGCHRIKVTIHNTLDSDLQQ